MLLSSYRFVDFARKVVGVGSVGTEAFVFLLVSDRERDVLFLQLKQAQASVIAPWVTAPAVVMTDAIEHDGHRVVVGQRLGHRRVYREGTGVRPGPDRLRRGLR